MKSGYVNGEKREVGLDSVRRELPGSTPFRFLHTKQNFLIRRRAMQENASPQGLDGKLIPITRLTVSSWQILPRCA